MARNSELQTFDGLDNRREIMILLERLGSDGARAKFLKSLLPKSVSGLSQSPLGVWGNCTAVSAYFLLVGMCNELRVPINEAARQLEQTVSSM